MLKICQGESTVDPIDIKPKTKPTSLFSCASDDAQMLVSKKTFFKSSSEVNKANKKGHISDFEENNIDKDNSESDNENDEILNKIPIVEINKKMKIISTNEDESNDMSKVNDNKNVLLRNSI